MPQQQGKIDGRRHVSSSLSLARRESDTRREWQTTAVSVSSRRRLRVTTQSPIPSFFRKTALDVTSNQRRIWPLARREDQWHHADSGQCVADVVNTKQHLSCWVGGALCAPSIILLQHLLHHELPAGSHITLELDRVLHRRQLRHRNLRLIQARLLRLPDDRRVGVGPPWRGILSADLPPCPSRRRKKP